MTLIFYTLIFLQLRSFDSAEVAVLATSGQDYRFTAFAANLARARESAGLHGIETPKFVKPQEDR